MKIQRSKLPFGGAMLLSAFRSKDHRGKFEKYFEAELCSRLKFKPSLVRVIALRKGATLGSKYRLLSDASMVWCLSGSVRSVMLDMRVRSPTFRQVHAIAISAKKGTGIFVPQGVAQSFQSLERGTMVLCMDSFPSRLPPRDGFAAALGKR